MGRLSERPSRAENPEQEKGKVVRKKLSTASSLRRFKAISAIAVLVPILWSASAQGSPSDPGASDLCNAEGNHCAGRWNELVDHLVVSTGNEVTVQLLASQRLGDEIFQKGNGFCRMDNYSASGAPLVLNIGRSSTGLGRGEGTRVVLNQLTAARLAGERLSLRIFEDDRSRILDDPATPENEAAPGLCFILYARVGYSD